MGFEPSKGEPDIWMRQNGGVYEYIGVYVDDLAIVAKDPWEIVDVLEWKYKFKLKGTGPISFHLGMGFFHDEEGVLCLSPKRYIERMISTYVTLFGVKPSMKYSSPLEKGNHPETNDILEFLDATGTQQFQSLIGALQWSVSIVWCDVTTAVMTMSSFCAMPHLRHMTHVKWMYGYLSKMKDSIIHIRTGEPDYSARPDQEFNWGKSVYGNVSEMLPSDAPKPLGKYITLTHYYDANLFHDIITGRSITSILHLINKTPLDWYSKKQTTIEMATYGSEFVAAHTCVDQIIDLCTTLCYLGVPLRDRSYVFGDNKTVMDSSIIPYAKLHKRHNALSFHHVCEAIAAKFIVMHHINGIFNPADILSKHWAYPQVWHNLKPLLFFQGDMARLYDEG
jgi:Reverse transcriptase (RNA-dependent DNA polymerase)